MLRIANIGGLEAASCPERAGGRLAGRHVNIRDDDLGAFRHIALRDGKPDAAGTAGNDRDFAVKLHGLLRIQTMSRMRQ